MAVVLCALMPEYSEVNRIYQRIGEFVVAVQFAEARVRELGWLLHDPDRNNWPPTALRSLTNRDLLNRVQETYCATVSKFPGDGADEYYESFMFVIAEAHRARRVRNELLHSAFIELKGGDEVFGLVRLNPRVVIDEDGEHEIASEHLSDAGLLERIARLGPLVVALNMHHTQLLHWAPFDPRPQLKGCGLLFHITGLPFAAQGGGSQA